VSIAAIDHQPALPVPSRLGQGTAVEQSRAIAEVQAAVVVAQQMPRDINRAVRDMERSCAQKSLAEKAFFRYSRGGSQISGPSVQLARELARCFGNMQYGIVEMRRDDGYGQSEMLAFAWDLETNTRSSTTFIVPHIRDTNKGSKALTDQRDIYENNANNGARRLREMVFAVLPGWYTEDAVAACYETLAVDVGDGTAREERISSAVAKFGEMGVTLPQLEQKLGAPRPKWTPTDLAQLSVIYRSLMRGEAQKEDEFPSAAPSASRVTLSELGGNGNGNGATPAPPADAAPAHDRPPAKATTGQVSKIEKEWQRLGYEEHDREEMLVFTAAMAILPSLAAFADLTQEQAKLVYDELVLFPDRVTLVASVSPRVTANARGSDAG
jgi:hypothetical protein